MSYTHAGLIDPDDLVVAPPVQYAVNGSSYTLQCEVEEDTALVSWMEPGETHDQRELGPHIIQSAALEDEGEYTCVVYFPENDIFTQKAIQLYVVGKNELQSNLTASSLSINHLFLPQFPLTSPILSRLTQLLSPPTSDCPSQLTSTVVSSPTPLSPGSTTTTSSAMES